MAVTLPPESPAAARTRSEYLRAYSPMERAVLFCFHFDQRDIERSYIGANIYRILQAGRGTPTSLGSFQSHFAVSSALLTRQYFTEHLITVHSSFHLRS